MGDISAHFSRSEFRDRRTGELVGPSHELVHVLEAIRAQAGGRPLRIVSGYRSPSSNAAVGGARRSQHLKGTAADIPPGFVTPAQAAACGARGIGKRGMWATHVDVRPGAVTIWSY